MENAGGGIDTVYSAATHALAAHAFDAIHRIYSNDAMLPLALRGAALAAANLPPLQRVLWRRAAGLA